MRRRRGQGSAPLSLFSFQDIITTVSGIMLLAMLLLALEVVARPARPPAPPGETAAPPAEDSERLRAEIDAANREARDAARLNLDGAPEKIRRMEQETARDRDEAARLKAEAETSRQSAQAAARAAEQAHQEEARALEELERLRKRLDDQEAMNRVHYTFARVTNKTPILVECSAAGIAARVAGRSPQTVSFVDPSSPHHQTSLRRFQAWARGRNPAREAFIVLVKPSAAGYAADVINALKRSGFDAGHEPLEEDRTAVGEGGPKR